LLQPGINSYLALPDSTTLFQNERLFSQTPTKKIVLDIMPSKNKLLAQYQDPCR